MKIFGLRLFEFQQPRQLEIKGEIPAFEGINELSSYWGLISSVKRLAESRAAKLEQFKRMGKHTTINAALEMMSEDATQIDQEKRRIFWVESDDSFIEDELNAFLYEKVRIQDRLFLWAYRIGRDGECYLKTFFTEREKAEDVKEKFQKRLTAIRSLNEDTFQQKEEKKRLLEETFLSEEEKRDLEVLTSDEYYEEVQDSSQISNLTLYGKTVGFLQIQQTGESKLFPAQDFVHFCSDRNMNREEVSIEFKNKEGAKEKRTFTVKYGTSFLEGVIQDFNVVELLENVMVVSRLSRSQLFRLFMVEVGGASNPEAIKTVRDFANSIKNREAIDVRSGKYTNTASPLPIADNIFIPTRQGKGNVNVQDIGGNVDVRSIVDFDFFWNKFCGGLKVPSQYLNFQDAIGGQYSNTSLTRLDIRYARTVKRIVTTLQSGIEELIKHHLESIGKYEEWGGKYIVKSTPVSDAEESDRLQDISTKVDFCAALGNVLTSVEGAITPLQQKAVLIHFLKTKVGIDIFKVTEDFLEQHPEEAVVSASDGSDDASGDGSDDLSDLESQIDSL